jgi:hypothetical protein
MILEKRFGDFLQTSNRNKKIIDYEVFGEISRSYINELKLFMAHYNAIPNFKNELLNKTKVSGQISSARRRLFEKLLNNIDDNNLVAFFQPGLSSMIISTPLTPYLDNKFHNLTLTINRSSMMYLYVDGVTVGTPVDVSSTSAMNPNSSDKFYIGSYGSSDGQSPLYFFKGNIGQALMYNRALTSQEVTTNFNVSKSRYDDITIGSQVWTSKNLDVTTYRNGDVIPQVTDPTVWASLTTGAWCYFNNNPVQSVLDQFPDHLRVKAIRLIIDYDAIWNGEVIEERLEMVKDKLII